MRENDPMVERKNRDIGGILNHVIEATAWISSIIIIIMMLLIVCEVFQRYFLRSPSRWISDFVSLYLLIYITLLPAGWILLKGEHVSVDIFVSRLGEKSRHYLNFVILFLGLFYSIVLTWQGWLFTWRELTHGTTFPTTAHLPVWLAVFIIFIGGVLLCLAFIMKIGIQLRFYKYKISETERLTQL